MTEAALKPITTGRGSSALPVDMNGAAHIVAILPRGEAIRNFVYSGVLEKLAAASKVTVLSVKPNEAIWADLGRRYGEVHELRTFPNRYPVRILREVLDVCHGRWLWSEAARERWRRRDLEARTLPAKARRLGKKLLILPVANRTGLRFLERMERTASRMLTTTNYYLDLYRQLQPTLVFNASHVHSHNAVQAVEAAQWLGIPTATFIFSWDNLTSQGRVLPAYDYYLVWNEEIRKQLLEIYEFVRPEQVFVTGTPQFDCHFRPEFRWSREEFCQKVGADPARPIVLYSTGMENHMPEEPAIVEQIADMLPGMKDQGSPQLLVRVYAKDRTSRFDELKARRTDILFPNVPWEKTFWTPLLEDSWMLANTLRHCALGINVASTVSLELCMFDKPVINVGYNPPGVPEDVISYYRYYSFDHYRPVVESGAVQVARSAQEINSMIRHALACPESGRAQRQLLLRKFFGELPNGESGNRVAEVLASIGRKDGNRKARVLLKEEQLSQ
jgi:hypothetical protein